MSHINHFFHLTEAKFEALVKATNDLSQNFTDSLNQVLKNMWEEDYRLRRDQQHVNDILRELREFAPKMKNKEQMKLLLKIINKPDEKLRNPPPPFMYSAVPFQINMQNFGFATSTNRVENISNKPKRPRGKKRKATSESLVASDKQPTFSQPDALNSATNGESVPINHNEGEQNDLQSTTMPFSTMEHGDVLGPDIGDIFQDTQLSSFLEDFGNTIETEIIHSMDPGPSTSTGFQSTLVPEDISTDMIGAAVLAAGLQDSMESNGSSPDFNETDPTLPLILSPPAERLSIVPDPNHSVVADIVRVPNKDIMNYANDERNEEEHDEMMQSP